jgi:hypothetical protein
VNVHSYSINRDIVIMKRRTLARALTKAILNIIIKLINRDILSQDSNDKENRHEGKLI